MRKKKRKLRFGLTDVGKVVLRGTGFVILAAMAVPAFGALSILFVVILTALVVGYFMRPRIRVSGELPDHIIAGQAAKLHYCVENISRLPAYNLSVAFDDLPETIEQTDQADLIGHLGSGESMEINVTIKPNRRGFYNIKPPVCQSSFPFNIFRFGISQDYQQRLVVLPVFYRLGFALRQQSRYVRSGSVLSRGYKGASLEYAGNRPFMSGDSLRQIDSRAWARLSVPATREYNNDFDNYTALILDTRIGTDSNSSRTEELEAAVSLCASVAFSVNDECFIDFLLAGDQMHQFAARPRSVRLDKIHEILAGVKSSEGYSFERDESKLFEKFCEISDAVFILTDFDQTYRHLVDLARQAGCNCRVILISQSFFQSQDTGVEPELTFNRTRRTGDFNLLSPDEVLVGRIKRL